MRTPKRVAKSSRSATSGTRSMRSSGLSESLGSAGWRARKLAMAPNRKLTVAPVSRTTVQNSPALNRRRTTAVAPSCKHA